VADLGGNASRAALSAPLAACPQWAKATVTMVGRRGSPVARGDSPGGRESPELAELARGE
jgi:hypothetical protein